MAIWQEINEYHPYKHTCAGRGDPDGSGLVFTECYECRNEANLVEFEGKQYVNWPGGRIEKQHTSYGDRVFSVTHEGLTICSRERNYYDDSDFYALVWDPKTQSVDEVSVGTTRLGGTDFNRAHADLSPEYAPAYREYLVLRQIASLEAHEKQEWAEAAYAAVTPGAKGQQVVVFKGRKVPIGFAGTIIWVGEGFRGGTRIGIRSDSGDTQFTDATNCKVVIDPDDLPYESDFAHTPDERRATAEALVDHGYGFRGLIASIAPSGITHVIA